MYNGNTLFFRKKTKRASNCVDTLFNQVSYFISTSGPILK